MVIDQKRTQQPYTNYKSTYANQYTAKDNEQPHLAHVKHA